MDERNIDLFLGIQIYTDVDGNITMPQSGLIDTVIQILGLEGTYKQHRTPEKSLPMHRYKESDSRKYRSPIGILTT